MSDANKTDDTGGPPTPPPPVSQDRVAFHYTKGPDFRAIHADGVYGGITPTGHMHLAFFAERFPIPQRTEHTLSPDGQVGPEIPGTRTGRDGLVRELQVDVFMSADAARVLLDFLTNQVRHLGELETKRQKGQGTP